MFLLKSESWSLIKTLVCWGFFPLRNNWNFDSYCSDTAQQGTKLEDEKSVKAIQKIVSEHAHLASAG